ncbi:PREDICTED: transmembrane protein 104 isoform X1 [Lepidothrix coronata]|uniref:Transmembrane protein 104 isoform X1 n=1 Tax=Lepidothrix coronata TaxID=321398 RepID=A0A6J0H0B3_9PASS|nr:PREDICTED: transmembrane protein 104 isoform X1 [Lepidothrix coronata]XP_017667544.1 PREDICTED: transmembrane protein 104 isoform X1 [Lepidothrix coronata]XP_017667545.1 PREDICTED: transmembrane protein 104 isoform X1 [Lepidothrix coronata]XP_017667546.1 PREDICTED: transmembrane protein 104 isoform X1 [Lepidothrix coronata]
MAGGITDTGELYSPYVGLVYMFNLIVGTGALTMPKAFATAGWLVSLILLMFLGFMSYMTTTFVVEAMAAANAQLRWKRMEKRKEDDEDEDSSSGVSDSDVLLPDGYERAETRPILSVQRRGSPNIFEITERVEMGQMASMFFNKVGVNLFYFCIIIYLYGDLAIYAAAVPVSLMQVTCSVTGNHSCSVGDGTKYNDTDKCWGPIRRIDAYRLYLAAFTLLLGPFTFFNVQKTKYLQIMTSLMRWIGSAWPKAAESETAAAGPSQSWGSGDASEAFSCLPAFILMIILALIRISRGQAEGHPSMAQLSGIRNLFGVCVYSFMCQHSLPSLITPISKKKHVNKLVLLDYILILAFYSLLSFTAIYCFRNDTLMDMYTLNFTNCEIINVAFIRYFLGLFPVFTISTNFPIIAVTLRNNWKTLFHREGGTYPWVVDRIVFPAITLIPPVLVAFCTHDLESLVGITGAYAGNGIQYLIPAFLAYCSRKDTQLVFGSGTVNKHLSPFRHTFWIVFVLIWGFSCFVFVTANIVLSESKL